MAAPTPAQPASCASAAGLLALPDDLLVACLSRLSQEERLRHVPRVCKRFRMLCFAAPLLASIDMLVHGAPAAAALLPRLWALSAFLGCHAQHVRSLRLQIGYYALYEWFPQQREQAAAVVGGCLLHCGGIGCSLQELHLRQPVNLPSMAWLPRLTALRALSIDVGWQPHRQLRLPAGIDRLSQLAEADLSTHFFELEPGARLPARLTRLRLTTYGTEVPAQIWSQLGSLAVLHMTGCEVVDAPLTCLASVTQLHLLATNVPAWLSALTGLRQLATGNMRCGSEAPLLAALQQLRHLTTLSLMGGPPSCIPPALADMPHLQRLTVNVGFPGDDLTLPHGAWLASIRWLCLWWEVLRLAAGVLSGAPRLEHLACMEITFESAGDQAWNQFWQFLATHPPLRCVSFGESGADPPLLQAIQVLNQQRPQLRVRRISPEEFNEESQTLPASADIPLLPDAGWPTET